MKTLRNVIALALALGIALMPSIAMAQQPVVFFQSVDPVSGQTSVTKTDSTCVLVKYRGTTAGKPTVEVAAGGDVTFKIAGSADTTTGSPNLDGVFDLSTPAAAVDTWGEFVNLVNTTGSNWVAVLVSCLATDLTDNTAFTLSATDASSPKGVALIRDESVASATSIFSAQEALLWPGGDTDIRYFLSGGPIGSPGGATKVNPNPFANFQTFVQHIREKITSSGTVALNEVIGVTRTYDSVGKVSETTRLIWGATGANSTVEGVYNFHAGPLVGAKGEMILVRQRTATDLTAVQIAGSGYIVRR